MAAYTNMQINVWRRGLLEMAWADGDFTTAERTKIIDLTHEERSPQLDLDHFTPISPDELVANFGHDSQIAENFLRTTLMVALADGVYSAPEATLLHEFHRSLQVDTKVLAALESTLIDPQPTELGVPHTHKLDLLAPVAEWLDNLEIHDPRIARLLCKFIPPQCPFERDITLFGHKIVHIPPMCKLNPLYDQTVGLRFRALAYLADECGEDVSPYYS